MAIKWKKYLPQISWFTSIYWVIYLDRVSIATNKKYADDASIMIVCVGSFLVSITLLRQLAMD